MLKPDRVDDALVYRQEGAYWCVKVIDALDIVQHEDEGWTLMLDSRECLSPTREVFDEESRQRSAYRLWRRAWRIQGEV